MEQTVYLLLENGKWLAGKAFGAPLTEEKMGELVFTTAMTGYLETLTDPSYYGQMVVQTFPTIGNYGVIPADFESEGPCLTAYIVREWCEEPSNFRSRGDLDSFLKERGIPGLCGVDTRALVRILRRQGVMNAALLTDRKRLADPELLARLRCFRVEHAVERVTGKSPVRYEAQGERRFEVALLDFGAKRNIVRELTARGCRVTAFPAGTSAGEILRLAPDGVMLSNGPGDPAENTGAIEEIKKLYEQKIPMFGICLGHQLMALAAGARTEKLKYGHRGANQPVQDTKTGRLYITSQNHGYAVVSSSLPAGLYERYVNGNDRSCEGVDYLERPAFSVQFPPEACGGPKDTEMLFDRFLTLMEEGRKGA